MSDTEFWFWLILFTVLGCTISYFSLPAAVICIIATLVLGVAGLK